MFVNPKVSFNLARRLIAVKPIQATECIAWCSRNYIFSAEREYGYERVVNDALLGYKDVPHFNLLSLATHSWFASRTSQLYAPHLLYIGMKRQLCKPLDLKQSNFIDHFTKSIHEDLKPVIDIINNEFGKLEIDTTTNGGISLNFQDQVRNTYEWASDRALNFKDSPLIPKGFKSLGDAVIVPLIDEVPHADKNSNTVVCVTSNNCEEAAINQWAEAVGIPDHTLLHRPVLLLATRAIGEGRQIFRDCSVKYVGVTSGKEKMKLPARHWFNHKPQKLTA